MQSMLLRTMASSGRHVWKNPPEVLLRQAAQALRTCQVPRAQMSDTASSTYRAAVCTALGQPLEVQDLPRHGALSKGQVRVSVEKSAVNFADLLVIVGKYQEKMDPPFVPGTELCGRVAEVGPGVTSVEPGQLVCGISMTAGAFAEEIILDSRAVIPIGNNVDPTPAAACLISYCTAYAALKMRANVQPGETVLVTAAAGATGLACVEIASKLLNAKVIGACGSADKCALVKEKGAFECINYNEENVRERVKSLTEGKGVNVVIDNVGGNGLQDCLRSLAYEGRLVVVGFASGSIPQIPANQLLVKGASALGLYWGSLSRHRPKAFLESILATSSWLQNGDIHPHVCRTFDLEKINDAFTFIQSRQSTGKVVINIK